MKAVMTIEISEEDYNLFKYHNGIKFVTLISRTHEDNVEKLNHFDILSLNHLPEKKNEKDAEKVYSTSDRSWTNGFSDGYNYCIDEILGANDE